MSSFVIFAFFPPLLLFFLFLLLKDTSVNEGAGLTVGGVDI